MTDKMEIRLVSDVDDHVYEPAGGTVEVVVNGRPLFAIDAATGEVVAWGVGGSRVVVFPAPGGQVLCDMCERFTPAELTHLTVARVCDVCAAKDEA